MLAIRRLICTFLLLTCAVGHAAGRLDFANGADVGWVTRQEAEGRIFLGGDGVAADPFVLLRNLDIDAVRLRVFVDSEDGWCNRADTLRKAERAVGQGQRLMIDFHYSDGWADPGKQYIPKAWRTHDAARLSADVYRHTRDTLAALKARGIAVQWVQGGNEINGGMLWPEGSADHFEWLTRFLNSGYDAVKSVYPDALVVVHLANGYDDSAFRWFFDHAKADGLKWDVIGMSHYPPADRWPAYGDMIAATMRDMVARYGKRVVISEVGMQWNEPQAAHQMLSDLIGKVRALGHMGVGVFYWEPEAWPGWQGYTMGAIDDSGKFTEAMQAFAESRTRVPK